MGQKGYS